MDRQLASIFSGIAVVVEMHKLNEKIVSPLLFASSHPMIVYSFIFDEIGHQVRVVKIVPFHK